MPVPTYDKFIEPLLHFLASHPDGVQARDAHEAVADVLGLSPRDRAEMLPSGAQAIYKNRIGWAHDRIKRAGYSTSIRRGFWQITPGGAEFVRQHSQSLSADELEEIATGNMDGRLSRPISEAGAVNSVSLPASTQSPDDRLEQALQEIRRSVAEEILEQLSQVTPQYFESIALDLLHKMGYGTNRDDLQRVGGVGDGGIDGVISLDRLGLEKVYVQAKRWQGAVGRPEVQAFYGALAGQRANKGVFITTSSYTAQALDFAKSVERIVLVDGPRLSELMIDHEVGVAS